ncbi:N-methyl-L-tryptophan oxidase [Nesterenkonia muleiensis]|uniref:N-methyl-L-tryptophan oxidase n=1 Tax=Nesterenkonia muleiensis TaxID=2282648 RepID=UPI000E762ACB|nr:N-methyl-L-tryptophan oxidase [Nesterenkonia muleiensis]
MEYESTVDSDLSTNALDVLVVGAGTMGAMTLWQLARRGVSCAAIEQFGIAHDQGAAGGDTRFYRAIYKEGSEYTPLLSRALELWHELEAETGTTLYTRTGALYLDDGADDTIDRLAAVAETGGVSHEIVDAATIRSRYPHHRVSDDQRGLVDPEAGFLRADRAIASALLRAQELGARLVTGERVIGITSDADGVTVQTDKTFYRAERVVLTTGPWDALLPEVLSRRLDIAKVLLTWYLPKNATKFSVGEYISVVREGGRFFSVPTTDGETIKFGDTSILSSHIDPDAFDRRVRPEYVAATDAAVSRYLPDVIPTATRASIHHEAFTDDHHPFVGVFDDPRIVIGCGFSGHGFKLSPTFGEALADLSTAGETAHDIAFLSPHRGAVCQR